MAKKINFGNVLNENSMKSLEFSNKIKNIEIEKIVENEKNFYTLSNIEELKNSIEENGLFDNLVVNEQEDGTYLLISGHRRFTACKMINKESKSKFKTIPCKVYNVNDMDELQWLLIEGNCHNRKMTDFELLEEVEQRKKLYANLKLKGHKLGAKTRELISRDMGISTTQVQRYEQVSKNITPEIREVMKEENLSINQTAEIISLNPEQQEEKIKQVKNKIADNEAKEENIVNVDIKDFQKSIKPLENDIIDCFSVKQSMKESDFLKFKKELEKIEKSLKKIYNMLE